MFKKLAKIKYLPNNYQILQQGDHVICAISGKKIPLDNLTDLKKFFYLILHKSRDLHSPTPQNYLVNILF